MSTRQELVEHWQPRLAGAGLGALATLLQTDEPPATAGTWETLHKEGLGGRRRWRWTLPEATGGGVLYVKRYARTPWRQQWDRAWRQVLMRSRAAWEYAVSRRLTQVHISVPTPVGFVEQMCGPVELRSAVLLERAPGDGLDRVWRRLCDGHAPITIGPARHDLTVRLAPTCRAEASSWARSLMIQRIRRQRGLCTRARSISVNTGGRCPSGSISANT